MSANTGDFPQSNVSDVPLCRKRQELPSDSAFAPVSPSISVNRPISADDLPIFQPCKKIKKKHLDPAVLNFRCCIQQCCKNDDLQTAIDAYERAIEDQTRIEAQTFYSLLCLCDGLGDRGIHVGTPKSPKVAIDQCDLLGEPTLPAVTKPPTIVDNMTRQSFAERLKCHIDELKLPLTENAYTALVRIFCRSKDVPRAERILTEAEATQQCKAKLRLYSPLLDVYCDEGQILEAVRIWYRLSKKGLVLSEAEYCFLIRCCRLSGNAFVFQRVLSDLSEDVLVPSHETTRSIAQWFQSTSISFSPCPAPVMEELHKLLNSIRVPHEESSNSICNVVSAHSKGRWTISDICQVDTSSGMLLSGCLKDASLEPVTLSPTTWNEMKRMNENIALTGKVSEDDTTSYQGGGKGRKIILDSRALAQRQQHWTAFQAFLQCLDRPVDVLVDGANVGFYEQNFNGAPKHVDYHQIDWVLQHFIREQKSVLLVMHSRHFAANLMPPYAKPILQRWIDCGVLYQTPPGMNDDWFWLHAALHFGPGTLIVTNDEMRDHHFQMVAPRSFLRWRDRHQIHFSFGGWVKNDGTGDQSLGRHREVTLIYPDTYSRRIQCVLDGIVIPLPKRGDKNRFLDGVFVADEEPEEEMYLCMRPSSNNTVLNNE